jgi:hypothetical protein
MGATIKLFPLKGVHTVAMQAVLTNPYGTASVQNLRVETVQDHFGNIVLDTSSEVGVTNVKAVTEVAVVAPLVTLPAATFTDDLTTIDKLQVTGDTTLAAVTATSLTADTVTCADFKTENVLEDDMTVTARKIIILGDLQIDGTLDTINTTVLTVRDKTITLGAVDSDGDGILDDLTDASRDEAGIVIPGKPSNLPADKPEANYEHSVRWKLKEGDFATDGAVMAPHQKPMWTFSGGGVSISAPDANNRLAEWFLSPAFDAVTNQATLGMYFQEFGMEPVLVQNFTATS